MARKIGSNPYRSSYSTRTSSSYRRSSTGRTTRKKQPQYSSYSYNYSSNSQLEDNSGCGMAIGIAIMILCVIIFFWSLSWDWVSYTRKMHQRVDWGWLKFIFYPGLIGGFLFGLMGYNISRPKENANQTDTQSPQSSSVPDQISQEEKTETLSAKEIFVRDNIQPKVKEIRDRVRSCFKYEDLDALHAEFKSLVEQIPQDAKVEGISVNEFRHNFLSEITTRKSYIRDFHIRTNEEAIPEIIMLLTEMDNATDWASLCKPVASIRVKLGVFCMHTEGMLICNKTPEFVLSEIERITDSRRKKWNTDEDYNSILFK